VVADSIGPFLSNLSTESLRFLDRPAFPDGPYSMLGPLLWQDPTVRMIEGFFLMTPVFVSPLDRVGDAPKKIPVFFHNLSQSNMRFVPVNVGFTQFSFLL